MFNAAIYSPIPVLNFICFFTRCTVPDPQPTDFGDLRNAMPGILPGIKRLSEGFLNRRPDL
jgi:hypothetical protein